MSALFRGGIEAKKRLVELWGVRELRVGWAAGLVIVIAVAVAFFSRSERVFRLSGLVLQIIGIAAVALNIWEVRKLNKQPGIFEEIVKWWRRVLGIKRPVVITSDMGGSISWKGHRGNYWLGDAPPNAPLEEQVDSIRQNVTVLKERLDQFEQDTAANLGRLAEAHSQEERVRAHEDLELREKLKVAQVGGLDVAMAGLVSLGIGVIMSTIPSELVCFANFLFP